MFFVFSKEKSYTYIVSIVTVILLFFVASNINNIQNNITTNSRETTETTAEALVENLEGIGNTTNSVDTSSDIGELVPNE